MGGEGTERADLSSTSDRVGLGKPCSCLSHSLHTTSNAALRLPCESPPTLIWQLLHPESPFASPTSPPNHAPICSTHTGSHKSRNPVHPGGSPTTTTLVIIITIVVILINRHTLFCSPLCLQRLLERFIHSRYSKPTR